MADIDVELLPGRTVTLGVDTPSVTLGVDTPSVVLDVNVVTSAAQELDDLTDVDTTGVTDGDALVYSSSTSTWGPGAGGVADDAWTQVDLTSSWVDLLTGFGAWDFGPDGYCTMRWTRVGRTIRGNIWGAMDATSPGHSTGIMGLPEDQLPVPPYLLPVGSAVTTNFGYVGAPETSGGAGDGHIVTIGPIFTDLGFSTMNLLFVHFNPVGTDGGTGNLWCVDGGTALGLATTPDLSLRTITFQSSFEYEAATAA